MLVSICGSQGSGKTTLIDNIVSKYNFPCVDRKTARSILNDWSMSLAEIYQDDELICDFQTELVHRKWLDEQYDMTSNRIAITERSFMDLFTYAVSLLGNNPQYNKWLDDYYELCNKYQQSYHQVFYLLRSDFDPVDDGVRPTNKFFANMIDGYLQYNTKLSSPDVIFVNNNADTVDLIYNTIQQSLVQVSHDE